MRRHGVLHWTIVVIDLFFYVPLLVGRVPPGKTLLHREVVIGINVQGHAFVFGVHNGDLVNRFPFRDCLPFVEKRNSGFGEPLSQYAIESVMLSSQIIA